MDVYLAALLALSLSFNAFLIFLVYQTRKAPRKEITFDAQTLMHDLTTVGSAMVKVSRIDPGDVWIKRTQQ